MNNSTKIIVATAAGMAAGAILGILFAPDKGSVTRNEISDQFKKVADNLETSFQKTKERLSDLKEKVEEVISEKVEEFS